MSKTKFNPVTFGDIAKDEKVLPIKKRSNRLKFKKLWLNSKSKLGFRNWVIFCVGLVTGLRASDLVRLQWKQVYRPDGTPRRIIVGEEDQKTGKVNRYLDIRPLHQLLIKYNQWLGKNYRSKWMFYKATSKNTHITRIICTSSCDGLAISWALSMLAPIACGRPWVTLLIIEPAIFSM